MARATHTTPVSDVQDLWTERISPQEAVIEMGDRFAAIAKRCAPRDVQTQGDIIGEICLHILLIKEPATRAFFFQAATWCAIQFCRRESRRRHVSIDAILRAHS